MRTKPLMAAATTCLIILGGCSEREDPLMDKADFVTATEINRLELSGTDDCALVMANPASNDQQDVRACNQLMIQIAKGLNNKNFTDRPLLPEDLTRPSLWQSYEDRYLD